MLNTRLGSTLNDFMFAAHVVSFFQFSRRVLYRFTMQDELDTAIKFNPKLFRVEIQDAEQHLIPVKLHRAWSTPFGTFLCLQSGDSNTPLHWMFLPFSNSQSVLLRVCLNRLRFDEHSEKPSLLAYFWRMNVLR